MKNPPPKLYVRGCFPAPAHYKYLCVIGSRKWTTYGRDAVNRIISGLRGYPISIVSGLAIGIDSIAHMAALEAGLHCVAFPGSSLAWNKIYPPRHKELARRIIDSGGAVVSPWKSDDIVGKWAFPVRNELMAALSHATLIVEAGKRSGSLMTAKHAEDMGRDVLAVPGHISAKQSYGPHMLIRSGAALITCAADVLRELGFEPTENDQVANTVLNIDKESRAILDLISLEEQTATSIKDQLKMPIQTLNEKLSLLEIKGLIKMEDMMYKLANGNMY